MVELHGNRTPRVFSVDESEDYLHATDPGRIKDLYNESVLLDHVSSASVLTGEVLIATGIYLAFLRHPAPSHLGLALEPSRCAVSLRF